MPNKNEEKKSLKLATNVMYQSISAAIIIIGYLLTGCRPFLNIHGEVRTLINEPIQPISG